MTPEEKLNQLLEDYGRGGKAKLAKFLDVSPVYVTRWVTDEKYSIPRDMVIEVEKFFNKPVGFLLTNNVTEIKTIPLIGLASCGIPNISYSDNIEHIPVSADIARDGVYAVTADGNSMLPKIANGDVVICDKNMRCENGSIVHYTTIDGDGGLKKYLIDDNGIVTLMPLNSDFTPILCDEKDLRCARAFKIQSNI